jgi:hypothetical protein
LVWTVETNMAAEVTRSAAPVTGLSVRAVLKINAPTPMTTAKRAPHFHAACLCDVARVCMDFLATVRFAATLTPILVC